MKTVEYQFAGRGYRNLVALSGGAEKDPCLEPQEAAANQCQ